VRERWQWQGNGIDGRQGRREQEKRGVTVKPASTTQSHWGQHHWWLAPSACGGRCTGIFVGGSIIGSIGASLEHDGEGSQ